MRRPLVMYDFATAPFRISLYMRKIWFYFLSVRERGKGGGRGGESYDRKKAWSSKNHSRLSYVHSGSCSIAAGLSLACTAFWTDFLLFAACLKFSNKNPRFYTRENPVFALSQLELNRKCQLPFSWKCEILRSKEFHIFAKTKHILPQKLQFFHILSLCSCKYM